jgi:hypothetical protein
VTADRTMVQTIAPPDPVSERRPVAVRCVPCSQRWVALYLPMEMTKAAELLKGLHCPNCGSPASDIRLAGEAA